MLGKSQKSMGYLSCNKYFLQQSEIHRSDWLFQLLLMNIFWLCSTALRFKQNLPPITINTLVLISPCARLHPRQKKKWLYGKPRLNGLHLSTKYIVDKLKHIWMQYWPAICTKNGCEAALAKILDMCTLAFPIRKPLILV